VAGVAITVSAVMLTRLTASTSMAWLFAAYVIFGIGFGMVNAPITNTAVSGMPRAQAGVAAAVASTSRQVGQSLGVAVIGSVVVSALVGSFRTGFATATHAGWWIMVGCGCAVLLLGLLTSGSWARGTAQRTADRLMPATPKVPVQAP
jgi:Na+/melibiose symporter-like transporter